MHVPSFATAIVVVLGYHIGFVCVCVCVCVCVRVSVSVFCFNSKVKSKWNVFTPFY